MAAQSLRSASEHDGALTPMLIRFAGIALLFVARLAFADASVTREPRSLSIDPNGGAGLGGTPRGRVRRRAAS